MAKINYSTNQPRINFEEIPEPIRKWLTSDTSSDIILEINGHYNLWGDELRVIPRLITRFLVGQIAEKDFSVAMVSHLPFLKEKEVNRIVHEIKVRLLKPIATQLRDQIGIDVEKIVAYEAPRETNPANEMKMEKVPPRTVNLRGATSPAQQAHPSQPHVATPPPPKAPEPKTEKTDQPFHLVEEAPAQETQPPAQPQPPTPPQNQW